MPEVIEIRKYADFLRKILKNKYIKNINILQGRYLKHGPFHLYKELNKDLPIKVLDIKTKGKFLYMILDKNYYIFSTLGLRGGWTYYSNQYSSPLFPTLVNNLGNYNVNTYKKIALNHLNIEFILDKGKLYFFDQLSFGTMKVINNKDKLNKKLNSLGPDIMDITFDTFQEQIKNQKNLEKSIGIVLMNQKTISGIGNYLRSDILWCSKISPFRKVADINDKELKTIYKYAKILTWGDYDYHYAIKKNIIKKSNKLPKDYGRNFFVYDQEKDINNNIVTKEPLFEGSQKRFIYWVKDLQK